MFWFRDPDTVIAVIVYSVYILKVNFDTLREKSCKIPHRIMLEFL